MNNTHDKNQNWLTNFCESLRIFVSIVMVQLVVVIYSFSFITFDNEYLRRLSILSLLAQLVGIVLLVCLCKLRRFFNRFSVVNGVVLLVMLIIFITTLMAQVIGYINIQLAFDLFENFQAINYLNFKLSISSVLMCLALVRYFYVQDQWQRQIQKHADARLNALQARIKPHFLFNSLNSITALIAIDAQKAELAITDFADLMRQAFTNQDKTIPLADEIKWVKQYIAIEKLRMGDRLEFKLECSIELLPHKIPVLCLQPLVENAVIHGIALLEHGGKIDVEISQHNNNLIMLISNPFVHGNNDKSNGMALNNIKERLKLLYGDKAYMQINTDNNHYSIKVSLPL